MTKPESPAAMTKPEVKRVRHTRTAVLANLDRLQQTGQLNDATLSVELGYTASAIYGWRIAGKMPLVVDILCKSLLETARIRSSQSEDPTRIILIRLSQQKHIDVLVAVAAGLGLKSTFV